MASPPESQMNLSQSSAVEKKETNISLRKMVGVLNNESTKQVSFSGGEKNKFIEAEFNITHVHKYKDNAFKESISDIKDRLELLFTFEESLTDMAHREADFTSTISLKLLHPAFSTTTSTIVREIALNELLLPDNGCGRSPKRILIMSEAGDGKTTLCHKIVYDWTVERADNLAVDCQLLLLYNLKKLTANDHLEAVLKRLCCEHKDDLHLVETIIQADSTNTLLILDGFDQVERRLQNHVLDFIRNVSRAKSSFRRPTVVLTCNKSVADASLFQLFHRHILFSRQPIGFQNDGSAATATESSTGQLPDLCGMTSSKEHPVETLLKSFESKKKDDKEVCEAPVVKFAGLDIVLRGKRTTEKDVQNFFAKFQ